jgi:hypothetical protein
MKEEKNTHYMRNYAYIFRKGPKNARFRCISGAALYLSLARYDRASDIFF